MKVKQIKIKNFRTYKEETVIDINDLNVFVGKNDIGKSTILEALDIFFNEGKGIVSIDKSDVNIECRREENEDIKISVIFDEVPNEIIIDATYTTTFEDEYLLLEDGTLEIIKIYPKGGKEKVFLRANHPTNPQCSDLLLKKNNELKRILDELGYECEDRTKNALIRKAIWDNVEDLQLNEIEIEVNKIDSKDIWLQLKNYMPLYALFQCDRKNSDGDDEVQNPMKLAVREILKDEEIKSVLDEIAGKVERKLQEVSDNTLEKLNEMNPEIADSLNPIIPPPDSLKWFDVFKNVNIVGDEEIPINKRGSGVKRLVLLNFFRAEAERRQREENVPSIIYAIEEPETSQHPQHQRKLIKAFIDLSETNNTQVLLTTHSPSLVKQLRFEHVKVIVENPNKEVVQVERNNLPYPSLNEVNFLAFGESDEEYHNELYGYIEENGWLNTYKTGKIERPYIRLRNGNMVTESKILSEYIRHQIHHPENRNNTPYTPIELQQSISEMRSFIQANQN